MTSAPPGDSPLDDASDDDRAGDAPAGDAPSGNADGDADDDGSSGGFRNDTPFRTRPLSSRASRWFLVGALLLALATSFGMAYTLVDFARSAAQQAPADSTGADTVQTAPDAAGGSR
jgi:hypothetical protein